MYQILSLKYRPKAFDEIVGQPHIVQTLKNEIKKSRIANAYLFAGPRGIGKTTMARIVAKALNCVNGPTCDPCNSCASCQEIQAGNAMDVLELDGASNRGIDEVRQIRDRVKYAPVHGKYKVYIIDEVHMLTKEAFNALLKTIEEPPKHVVFILATTEPYKLPLTILSRCQRFNFKKISPHSIVEKVKTIAQLESVEIDGAACSLIAQLVDGSLRDAISVFDQLIPYTDGKIKIEDVQTLLGLPSQDVFLELTDAIIKRDPAAVIKGIQNIITQGVSYSELVSGLINHLQSIFFVKTGVVSDKDERYKSQAELLETSHLIRMINFMFDTERNMRNALSKEIYLEQALVRVAMCTQLPIEKLLTQFVEEGSTDIRDFIPTQMRKTSSGVKEVMEIPTDKTFEPEDYHPLSETPHQLWGLLCRKLKPSLESIVAQVTPLELEDGKLLVQCKNEFFQTVISENLTLIEEEIEKIANRPIKIAFEMIKDTKSKKKSLIEEPIVQSTIKIFNAEISNAERF
ncbi:MAG: DNA polymerase III subunit gamma/tau [Candidatus Stahlbacteria bacterium]|nr:DNA polymerase III subunit gamma/tau [Candidatus Stahlbacteria bacterium]